MSIFAHEVHTKKSPLSLKSSFQLIELWDGREVHEFLIKMKLTMVICQSKKLMQFLRRHFDENFINIGPSPKDL